MPHNKSLLKFYFENQIKYQNIYGNNTIVFIEYGIFYEIYEYIDQHGNHIGKCRELHEITKLECKKDKILKLARVNGKIDKDNKNIHMNNPYMIGFPLHNFDKFEEIKNLLMKYNYTIIIIDQVGENSDGTKIRKLTNIISPGTDINPYNSNSNNICSLYINNNNNISSASILDVMTGINYFKSFNNINFYDIYKFLITNNFSEILIYLDWNFKDNNKFNKFYFNLYQKLDLNYYNNIRFYINGNLYENNNITNNNITNNTPGNINNTYNNITNNNLTNNNLTNNNLTNNNITNNNITNNNITNNNITNNNITNNNITNNTPGNINNTYNTPGNINNTYNTPGNINNTYNTNYELYKNIEYQEQFFNKIFNNNSSLNILDFLNFNSSDPLINFKLLSYIYLLDFCYNQNENIIKFINKPNMTQDNNLHLTLEYNACQQLDIINNNFLQKLTKHKNIDSLFSVINFTHTNMGKLLLKNNLLFPHNNVDTINDYYNATDTLINNNYLQNNINDNLKNIKNLNRLHRKLLFNKIQPYELLDIIHSYKSICKIIQLIKKNNILKKFILPNNIKNIFGNLLKFITTHFDYNCISKNNKIQKRLRKFSSKCEPFIEIDLDDNLFLKNFSNDTFNNLKNKYNILIHTKNEFNKYINKYKVELTYDNDFCRFYFLTTQSEAKNIIYTLNKLDKYKNDPLKFQKYKNNRYMINNNYILDLLIDITNTKKQLEELLYLQYSNLIIDIVDNFSECFVHLTNFVAFIDVINSNCISAKKYNYYKPQIIDNDNGNSYFNMKQLRHPIVERIIDHEYITNDLSLGNSQDHFGLLLYGTNAAGKTTFAKAIALSIVMAQAGCYTPCILQYFPYNKILTRLSGNDNIFRGESSFVVEMLELKNILNNLGSNSLIICDELCRGTEQKSGSSMAIASILKFIQNNSTFIISTHMHQLINNTRIKQIIDKQLNVSHLSVIYNRQLDDLIYDRKLKNGHGGSIYGIEVARYLHLDSDFLQLANDIRKDIYTENNISEKIIGNKKSKYNSKKIIDTCQICNCNSGQIDTHHINEQQFADHNGFIKHFHKNQKWNLMALCSKCHNFIHKNNKKIKCLQTTSGIKYQIN